MSDRRPSSYARRLGRVVTKATPDASATHEQEQEPMPPATTAPEAPARAYQRRRGGQRIRVTVDLDREVHRALRQLALDADADASEIIRLLLGRALRDPGAAESIRAELEGP
jgi:hypothetical protein